MNDENALKCYECAVKADGQLDLILSMLAKLHALRSHENFMEKEIHSARQVVIDELLTDSGKRKVVFGKLYS